MVIVWSPERRLVAPNIGTSSPWPLTPSATKLLDGSIDHLAAAFEAATALLESDPGISSVNYSKVSTSRKYFFHPILS